MHDSSRFCCLNPDCPDHGQRGHYSRRAGRHAEQPHDERVAFPPDDH